MIKRIPRQTGLTNLSIIYQHNPNPRNKQRIIQHVITHYINQGFTYNHKPINLSQLSNITNIGLKDLYQGLQYAQNNLAKMLQPENIQDTHRAVVSLALNGALEDRASMLRQATLLLNSQGDGYKAFISSTVNQALKNQMDSTKALADIASKLVPQNAQALVQINNHQSQSQDHINTTKAVQIIEAQADHKNLSQSQSEKALLAQKYNLDDMPEVDARKQQGKGAKEGLNLKNLTEVKEPIYINHEDRREEDLGIVDDDSI